MAAGPESVSRKLHLVAVRFRVADALFSDPDVQQQVDGMSERARGNPRDADARHASSAPVQIEGQLSLTEARMHFQHVGMSMPGAQAVASGQYSLDGADFQLDGTVHTEAEASHMTTGIKSVLARPFNGLFSHGREGASMPLRIRGTGDQPKFEVILPGGKQIKAPGERH